MNLVEIVPILKDQDKQFKIPEGFKYWCHVCNRGFKTLEEGMEHDKTSLNEHRVKINK